MTAPSDNIPATGPASNTAEPTDTTPVTPPASASGEEKWKALSRANEAKWKAATKELDELKKAQMTDQEKALESAREEARKAALSEVGTKLAKAEIRVQASKAGLNVPTDYLDLNRFLSEDGEADTEKVKAFVASLAQNAPKGPASFPELEGVGHHKSTKNDITSMDPTELADLIANGTFI